MTKLLVLASGSSYRRKQLEQLNLPFQCHSPSIDETPLPGEPPQATSVRLSIAKARAVASTYPEALVIGSDQVGELDGLTLEKPGSITNACNQLRECSGRTVLFHSGLCLLSPEQIQFRSITTTVKFRLLSDAQIADYIKKEQPVDCAGSFKCEGLGIALFESIRSDDPSALIGLPLIALCEMLRQAGVDPVSH